MSKQNITERIHQDLQSADDKTVLAALTTVRQKGNSSHMPGIVQLLQHDSEEVRSAATRVLFDLKDLASVPVLLDCFDTSQNSEVRNIILQSLWQSNIQPVQVLGRLTGIAVKGTLEECIEVYSIVTNIVDVEIPEAELMESLLLINNAVENIKNKHQQQLLRDMAVFLQEQQDLGA